MAWHNGEWWPLYVPDWYHPRVSQHFFDPYSFLHILHGFIFYGCWGWWPPQLFCSDDCWWWIWLVGPVLALLAELTHEIVENSDWMIQLYRSNSGTSGLYEGDSAQNIVGDLISALFGWYLTALLHEAGHPWIVVIWYLITEVIIIHSSCPIIMLLSNTGNTDMVHEERVYLILSTLIAIFGLFTT